MPTKKTTLANSPIFRRRQRRKDHYHHLDKTILFAYPGLSDGAKMTYIVLDSYDWADAEGSCKGYSYPYQSTLAKVRGVSDRTIRNHLKELVNANLITIEVISTPKGRRNVYWIEECSQEEFERYLEVINRAQKDHDDEEVSEDEENIFRTSEEGVRKISSASHEENNFRYKDTNTNKGNKQDKTKGKAKVSQVMSGLNEIAVTSEEGDCSQEGHHDEDRNINKALAAYEVHLDKQASPADRRIITQLLDDYGLEWLEAAFVEITVQQVELGKRIKSPLRFAKGVLRNWAEEGGVNLTPTSV